jgi:hypothetical protein
MPEVDLFGNPVFEERTVQEKKQKPVKKPELCLLGWGDAAIRRDQRESDIHHHPERLVLIVFLAVVWWIQPVAA